MIKKRITYTDYNGTERTEDHYFHLSQAEVMEMEMGTSGGFVEMVQRIIDAQDSATLIKIFKDFLFKSYGIKSADGKRFEKSEEISTAFSQTEAYSILFMEFATNADEAAKFINGVIPKGDGKGASQAPTN